MKKAGNLSVPAPSPAGDLFQVPATTLAANTAALPLIAGFGKTGWT
jgi:hypothetical protein